MIVTFKLSGDKLAHIGKHQMGAFIAYCYGLKNFHSVMAWKTAVDVSFALGDMTQLVDSAKIQAQLNEAVDAFATMEPFPCPCGCGAYISVSPCHRQSGELAEEFNPKSIRLDDEEKILLSQTNKIGAIKHLRDRYGKCVDAPTGKQLLSLRDCVEACEIWVKTNY